MYYNWEWVHFIIQSLVLMTLVTLSLSAPQVLLPTTQTNILRMDGVEGGWIFHYTRYCPRKVLQRAFLTCILGPDFSFKNAKNWTGTWIHPKIMEACIFWTGSLGRKTCIFPRVNAYFLHVSATSEQKNMVHFFCGSGAGKTHAFSWQPQIWRNMHFPRENACVLHVSAASKNACCCMLLHVAACLIHFSKFQGYIQKTCIFPGKISFLVGLNLQ